MELRAVKQPWLSPGLSTSPGQLPLTPTLLPARTPSHPTSAVSDPGSVGPGALIGVEVH